jgi:hypothetical protein
VPKHNGFFASRQHKRSVNFACSPAIPAHDDRPRLRMHMKHGLQAHAIEISWLDSALLARQTPGLRSSLNFLLVPSTRQHLVRISRQLAAHLRVRVHAHMDTFAGYPVMIMLVLQILTLYIRLYLDTFRTCSSHGTSAMFSARAQFGTSLTVLHWLWFQVAPKLDTSGLLGRMNSMIQYPLFHVWIICRISKKC